MISKEQITDLFFDLDHTIYDFDKNSELTFQSIFSQMKMNGMEDFMTHFRPINEHYWERFANNEITRDFLRYGRLRDTFEVLNIEVSDREIDYIAEQFIDNLTNHCHVFHGAYEALDYLKTKYRLHIITNGPDQVQQKKLKNARLDHYFLTVTNSEKTGVKKPHPDIFNHALNIANAKPEHSVMIGDNLSADISGALNVGMNVVWFNELEKTTDLKITQIHQLNELINIF